MTDAAGTQPTNGAPRRGLGDLQAPAEPEGVPARLVYAYRVRMRDGEDLIAAHQLEPAELWATWDAARKADQLLAFESEAFEARAITAIASVDPAELEAAEGTQR